VLGPDHLSALSADTVRGHFVVKPRVNPAEWEEAGTNK
jgi:hypothetical protein